MLMRWPLFSVQKNGPNDFVLLVASADTQPDAVHDLSLGGGSVKLTVKYGDFSGPLSRVVKALAEVCQHAARLSHIRRRFTTRFRQRSTPPMIIRKP